MRSTLMNRFVRFRYVFLAAAIAFFAIFCLLIAILEWDEAHDLVFVLIPGNAFIWLNGMYWWLEKKHRRLEWGAVVSVALYLYFACATIFTTLGLTMVSLVFNYKE